MLDTPVLFLIFNRPDTTEKVFNAIKQAKPKQLFISADGPRQEKPGEFEKCQAARKIVEQVDWDCDLQVLFRDNNLGCKKAVSSGINWFFEQVDEGIILEDDCLPDQSFFGFCQELLKYYRNNPKIMHISGNNFQFGRKRGNASYYFSIYNHIWGWATWKRAWQYYDVTMADFEEFKKTNQIEKITRNKDEQAYWMYFFEKVWRNEIDTWDYQNVYSMWKKQGLAILPNVNLVSNIGFTKDATHTNP